MKREKSRKKEGEEERGGGEYALLVSKLDYEAASGEVAFQCFLTLPFEYSYYYYRHLFLNAAKRPHPQRFSLVFLFLEYLN